MIINNNCIAKQLITIKEIYSAIELGLNIYIADSMDDNNISNTQISAIEYTESIDEDIINKFKDGYKVYAGIKTLSGVVLKSAQTILTTELFIGCNVYYLNNNKVCTGEIVYISLSKGKNDLYNRNYILEKLCHIIQPDKSIDSINYNIKDSLERLTKDLFSTSYTVIKDDKYNYYIALPLNKVFKTKKELINSL